MKIVIFGLSITSSWGNGHATTFRALCGALHGRGHRILFYERNAEWYEHNRDLPDPSFCEVRIYREWPEVVHEVRTQLSDAEVAVVGSYFPDGIAALNEVLNSNAAVKAFYDIDTPITISALRRQGETGYLRKEHLSELDVYFSFTGGPMLRELETQFGISCAVPLYCSFDPQKYRRLPLISEFRCDLSYMGTYAPDRQPKIKELLCRPAIRLPNHKFIVAGPQYPESIDWPENVGRIIHLNPVHHAEFYCSSRFTLNVTRRDMVMAGYSPSVRLFEAAACGAAIVSDNWPGLDTFFVPGKEILVPTGTDDVIYYLSAYDTDELNRIGEAAQERVLAAHTSNRRAQQFEQAVERAMAERQVKCV